MAEKPKTPEDRSRASAIPPDEHAPEDRVDEIRKGGIQPTGQDPMKDEYLDEPYGKRSGQGPNGSGSAKEVVQRKPERSRK